MFGNYLIIALQSLKRRPGYSAIKILCLTLGLVCGILVLMHVQYVNSYDRHFPNYQNIYRLVASLYSNPLINANSTPEPYAPQLALDYPDIEFIARARPGGGLFGRGDNPSNHGIWWVEPDFLRIFTFDFISGDPATALQNVNAIVIDETTAAKYFPGEDPIGKTLTFNQNTDLIVSGLMRDLPENTHFDPQILASAETGRQIFGEFFMAGPGWGNFSGTRTYLTFADRAAAQRVAADLPAFIERNMPDDARDWAATRRLALFLEPLEEVYLSPRVGFSAGDDTRTVAAVFMTSMAALVLLTSCVNFANLFMTQVLQRNKELGVRKTLGANRRQIVVQLLFEALLLVAIALLLAFPLIWLLTPVYAAMFGESFTFATLFETRYLLSLLVFVLATAVLSGLVPAVKAARREVTDILKREAGALSLIGRLSRPAVSVIQFTCAATIIMLTLAVYLQVQFMLNRELGFNSANLLVMDSGFTGGENEGATVDAMMNEIRQHPGVQSLATSNVMPPGIGPQNPWRIPGSTDTVGLPSRHILVSDNYIDTMQFTLLAGRLFDPALATDFTPIRFEGEPTTPEQQGLRSIVITRDAVADFGFASLEDALGQTLYLFDFPYLVIGVVENFDFYGGLGDDIQHTTIMRATRDQLRNFLIRVDPLQVDAVQAHIDAVWERHRPDQPNFRYFFGQRYAELVDQWGDAGLQTTVFAGMVTLFISVCGLYALAFYAGQRRTKEIGVRKVLGADSRAIVGLLTLGFLKPVVVACLISLVTGTVAIQLIYALFANYPPIPVWLYLSVVLGIVAIAVVTTAGQSMKAARADPVRSLRYE